jgi:O-antigen/teichoic acid export membrane protein
MTLFKIIKGKMRKYIDSIIKKYIGDSNYKKNVLFLMSGRVIAQVIPILLTPLLTRIYSPGEFGIFSVYYTIVSLVSMVSSGRYCLAIILPKKEENARSLVFLSWGLSLLTTVFFGIVMLLVGDKFFTFLNAEILRSYLGLMLVNILFLGFSEAAYYYGLRKKAYKVLSVNVIVQSMTVVIFRLVLGYFVSTEYGLLLAFLAEYLISVVMLVYRLKIYKFDYKKEFNNLKNVASRYIRFPKYSLFADILSMSSNLSPNLFVNGLFGSVASGHYAMSDKILGSPIWFVTSSVGDVFKQEAAEQFRETGSAYKLFVKTAKTMFLLGIIPFTLIFLLVPYIIPFLLGAGWEPVGQFIRIFSVMYFAKFVVTPVSFIVYIVNKQSYNILFQSLRFISIIIAFALGYYLESLYVTFVCWAVLTTISYLIAFFVSLRLSKNTKSIK